MKLPQTARLLLLVTGVAGTGAAVAALTRPWLAWALGRAENTSAAGTGVVGFADLVSAASSLALLTCYAWLAAATLVVAARTLHPSSRARRAPGWAPTVVRVVVPALLGATAGTAPATAAVESPPRPEARAAATPLTGLPLPDRALTSPDGRGDRRARRGGAGPVVVRPGDSLWSIAARLLPDSAPLGDIDRTWRQIARANATHVPDPDLILPGTRLRVPLTVDPREEPS